MTQRLQGVIIGVVSTIIITGGIVFASHGSQTIEAVYNNIKIFVDGVMVEPKDANGNAVEPFIYNGTTYLPVRAVGEAIGKKVDWDGRTQSVYLGLIPNSINYLLDVVKPYQKNESYIEFDYSNNPQIGWHASITMGGKKYNKGFKLGTSNGGGYAIFNLDGKYTEVTAIFGIDDGYDKGNSNIEIWKDGKMYNTITAKTQTLPKEIKIDVTGVLQLKLTHSDAVSDVAFGEVTIK